MAVFLNAYKFKGTVRPGECDPDPGHFPRSPVPVLRKFASQTSSIPSSKATREKANIRLTSYPPHDPGQQTGSEAPAPHTNLGEACILRSRSLIGTHSPGRIVPFSNIVIRKASSSAN